MEISIYSIADWVTAVIIGSLAIAIFLGSDRRSSKTFAFSIFWVMMWYFTVGLLFYLPL